MGGSGGCCGVRGRAPRFVEFAKLRYGATLQCSHADLRDGRAGREAVYRARHGIPCSPPRSDWNAKFAIKARDSGPTRWLEPPPRCSWHRLYRSGPDLCAGGPGPGPDHRRHRLAGHSNRHGLCGRPDAARACRHARVFYCGVRLPPLTALAAWRADVPRRGQGFRSRLSEMDVPGPPLGRFESATGVSPALQPRRGHRDDPRRIRRRILPVVCGNILTRWN
jgi:hypothetical protein